MGKTQRGMGPMYIMLNPRFFISEDNKVMNFCSIQKLSNVNFLS